MAQPSLFLLRIRLLFNRENKNLRAVLNTKSVLTLLEDNDKTVQALNSEMVTDDRQVEAFVEEILEREEWKRQRASKMDSDYFRQLFDSYCLDSMKQVPPL